MGYDINMEKWKSQIKELRLKQKDVANQLGMNDSYLSRLLNGKQKPPDNFELRLSLALTILSKAEFEAQKARQKVLSS